MATSSSSEITLTDDGSGGASAVDKQTISPDELVKRLKITDEAPPVWEQQVAKFGNVAFNSAVVALLRALVNPPAVEAAPEAGAGGVPEWYTAEWAQRARAQRVATRVARDTVALAAGCYLMDGVEAGMAQLRGKRDYYNKIMGGVAAGGVIGFAWYPNLPQGRALVTVAGALVGYASWLAEKGSNDFLFATQKELEKELLHKTDEQLRPELNPWYLRSLIRAKESLMQAARLRALENAVEQQRQLVLAQGGADTLVEEVQDTRGTPEGVGDRAPKTLGQATAAAGWKGPGSPGQSGYDGGVLVINEEGDGDSSRRS